VVRFQAPERAIWSFLNTPVPAGVFDIARALGHRCLPRRRENSGRVRPLQAPDSSRPARNVAAELRAVSGSKVISDATVACSLA
jgi:hypothetical protein